MAVNHSMAVMNGTLDLKLTYTHKGDSNGDLFETMNTYVPEAGISIFMEIGLLLVVIIMLLLC